ncbi:hypothetical protein OHD49_00315 [Escherichia coli]|nr:hypothetical protein [Escherichia coli]
MGDAHHVTGQLSGGRRKVFDACGKSFVAGTSLPGRLKRDVVVCTPESPSAENGRSAAADRQRQLRHQAQWPYTPSGVQERRIRRD